MKKRVLIFSASAGSGHVRAAEALEQAFHRDGRVGEVLNVDSLQYTNKLFRDFYSKLYDQLVKSAPQILGWVYKASDEPWKGDAVRSRLDRLNTRPLVKLIRRFDPHVTVCTHFMPAGIISHLIGKGQLKASSSIVVTDLDVHAMWLSRTFQRYFVAIPETKAHLEAIGLPSERITVSGIPIDPAFAEPFNAEKIREDYGLLQDRKTLLLSAGTLGAGPTEIVVKRLIQMPQNFQTIVVCGKSERLKERIDLLTYGRQDQFRVIGYTNRMHDLMKVSDILIGKPGGLTTAEALACGLPMAIVSPIPGQEERNSDHLLEEGVAIKFNELTTIPFKLGALLDDEDHLAVMRANARRIGRPRAAQTIVETLVTDELPPIDLDRDQRRAMAEAAARESR